MEAEQITAQQWQRINDLFHSALERGPDERAAFLTQACAGDESLRCEVEALLEAQERADTFFGTPALEVAAGLLAEQMIHSLEGRRLGQYQVLSLIGSGGMGQVFLAEDTRLKRKVAIKVLPAAFTVDPDRIRRFEQEAQAASSLNHPNIITIHEVGQVDDAPFIITEFIEGETLRQQMAAEKMNLREALDVAIQVASALEAAHKVGIVHRDIKPDNIMLRPDGLVKVLDFGLAKLTEAQSSAPDAKATALAKVQTKSGLVMGTVTYMSPEQARGLTVDARSDLFSLGTVIYEMVAGRLPFEGATTSDVIVSILEREPAPLSHSEPGVPAELERIVNKALAKDQDERYQLARDLLIDLRNLKQEIELQAKLDVVKPVGMTGATPAGHLVSVDTDERATTRSTDAEVALTAPSAAHLIGKLKTHKRAAVLGLAALLVAVTAIVYFTYFTRGEVIDSIAVLPFVNVGNDPNAEYLSDGISDNIIHSLSRLPNLKKVISFSSVMRYKGKQIDPQAVGRELNVGALITGRLTLRGNEILVSTELVDVNNNKRLWGEQYSHKLADVFRLQGEIAQKISERLRLRLIGEQRERLAKSHTDNPEAYGLYLLGRYYRRNRLDKQKAVDCLEQAIKIDPKFAPAYAQLAYAYDNISSHDGSELMQKARWAAQRALELDDTLGDAHTAWGRLNDGLQIKAFERAVELDPNSADAQQYCAKALWNLGRLDEAILHMRRAQELDPNSPAMYVDLGKMHTSARQFDQAMQQYRKALELKPGYEPAYRQMGFCYAAQERYEEAIAEAERIKTAEDVRGNLDLRGYIYGRWGKRAEALKILGELNELSKRGGGSPTSLAMVYTGLGDKDKAIQLLRGRGHSTFPLRVDPVWDSLRSDPRFEELLQRLREWESRSERGQ